MPSEFCKYFDYVWKLSFKSHPDYIYLRKLIKKMMKSNGISQLDAPFDWSENTKKKRKS